MIEKNIHVILIFVLMISGCSNGGFYGRTGFNTENDPSSESSASASSTADPAASASASSSAASSISVPVTGVSLSSTNLQLTSESVSTISVTVAPSDASDKTVTWTSSNSSVASVSADGSVTAVCPGSCTVTVTSADGAYSAVCTVTVDPLTSTYSLGSINMVFVEVPVPSGGFSFPKGADDSGTAALTESYEIAVTETTNTQWDTVKAWAVMKGYTFIGTGSSGDSNQPIVDISWRDAAVWCNALTEYINALKGTSYSCVYYSDSSYTTPLRTSDANAVTVLIAGSLDYPYIKASAAGNTSMANCIAKGFRLPSSDEWECAARYRGTDAISNSVLMSGLYWTKGNCASGATVSCASSSETNAYAVSADLVSTIANVQTRSSNALGIYDMCGNASEFCFDWFSNASARYVRGSDYTCIYTSMMIGAASGVDPSVVSSSANSFRAVRTK